MSKPIQFTSVRFPDVKPNFYDNLNNMQFDLNVSTKQSIYPHEIIRSTDSQNVYTYPPTKLTCNLSAQKEVMKDDN